MDSVRERTPFHHINYAVHRGVLFLHNFREEGGGGQKSLNTYVPKQIKSRCAHTVFKKTLNFIKIILSEIWLEVEIILMKMVKRDGQSWRSYMRIP